MSRATELLDAATPLPWPSWGKATKQLMLPEPEGRLAIYAVNRLPDYEAAVEAAMYALAFMNDPEGLTEARQEWRDQLHDALARLREGEAANVR